MTSTVVKSEFKSHDDPITYAGKLWSRQVIAQVYRTVFNRTTLEKYYWTALAAPDTNINGEIDQLLTIWPEAKERTRIIGISPNQETISQNSRLHPNDFIPFSGNWTLATELLTVYQPSILNYDIPLTIKPEHIDDLIQTMIRTVNKNVLLVMNSSAPARNRYGTFYGTSIEMFSKVFTEKVGPVSGLLKDWKMLDFVFRYNPKTSAANMCQYFFIKGDSKLTHANYYQKCVNAIYASNTSLSEAIQANASVDVVDLACSERKDRIVGIEPFKI